MRRIDTRIDGIRVNWKGACGFYWRVWSEYSRVWAFTREFGAILVSLVLLFVNLEGILVSLMLLLVNLEGILVSLMLLLVSLEGS
ncbi:hypothetical protein [Bacillus sp. ISL-57]|uniref:hypothetical protein n=1 Tax=Bacillus sp. ISL-57 TaxID=2819135 RepID=UPI001BE96904|nr:hypothetical protein [Bacillus sp. ISL-57]MBT2719443.1 hypothetical protein [Bacillus sp. ISL-57]